MTTLLMGDVWGQQPKRPDQSPPAPLLPAESVWVRELPALPAAEGAIDRDRVYIPLQESGIVALDRESGRIVWRNPLGTTWPLVLGASAVMVVANEEAAAIDRETGETIWRGNLQGRALAGGVVSGDLLIVALGNGTVTAVNTSDGSTKWACHVENLDVPVMLAADSQTVYGTTVDSQVFAIHLSSGELRWRKTLSGNLSPPAVGKDRVFVGSTSNAFFALNADSGEILWQWPSTMIGGDVVGASVDGDVTFFVGLDNLLHAVNRGNGNQRWKQPTPMRPLTPPRAFGGLVLVFGLSPTIATFNAHTGAPVGSYTIPIAPGATTAPIPKGPPLIDPVLRPFRVAMVAVTADGRAIGLRPEGMMFRESALAPLAELPGRLLPRERAPTSR